MRLDGFKRYEEIIYFKCQWHDRGNARQRSRVYCLELEGFGSRHWPSGFSISESVLFVGWHYHVALVSLKRFERAARTPAVTRKHLDIYSSETVSLEDVSSPGSPCKTICALASAPQPLHNFLFCLLVESRLNSGDKGHSTKYARHGP